MLSLPPKLDLAALALLIIGYLVLYLPSYLMLAQRIWSTDEQGHGAIILALSFYLLYAKRFELACEPAAPATLSGGALLLFGTALYAFGRSQYIMFFEILSQIFVLTGLFAFFLGWRALRVVWFPLFFMLFMVPLPGSVVAEVYRLWPATCCTRWDTRWGAAAWC